MSTHTSTHFMAPRNWPVAVWLLVIGLSSVLLNWCSLAAPMAKSPDCTLAVGTEYRSVSTSREKQGFSTFSTTTPPQKYQVMTVTEEASSASYPINSGFAYSPKVAAPGNLYATVTANTDPATINFRRFTSGLSVIQTYDTRTLSNGNSHADSSRHFTNNGQVYGIESSGSTNITGSIYYTPDALNGSQTKTYSQNCTTSTSTANGGLVTTLGTLGTVISPTEATTNSPSDYTPAKRRYNLSSEYSTAALLADAAADLLTSPSWGQHSSYSHCTGSSTTNSQPSPLAVRTLAINELSVSLQRSEYRFIFSTDRKTSYLVTWDEKTVLDDGSPPTYVHKRLQVSGNGQKIVTDPFELNPPSANGTRRIVNVQVAPIEGCVDCGLVNDSSPRNEPGSGIVGLNNGVQFSLDLGRGAFGFPAGSLWIAQERPSSSLATPAALNFSGDTNIVQVAYDGNQISRIVSHQMVAAVVPTNYAFSINCYAISNGVHLTNETPIGTWTFSNPDASPTVTNRYRIVQSAPGLNVTNDFNWNSGSSKWILSSGNGLRTNTQQTSWDVAYTNRTETYETWNPDSSLAIKRTRLFAVFPWGEGLVQEILDPAGISLTNIWTYDSQGRVSTIIRTDGAWEKFTYTAIGGISNLVNVRTTPFLNSSPSSVVDVLRTQTYDYTTTAGTPDDPSLEVARPRKTELQVNTARIQEYTFLTNAERRIISVPLFLTWNAAENIVTTIKYYTNSSFSNYIRAIHFPNQTVQQFTYAESVDFRTNIVLAGRYDSNLDLVVDGTKTVVVMDKAGQVRSKVASDILTSLVIDSEITTVDKLGRPIQTTYLDGRSNALSYAACCGVEFATNRAGSVVKYEYDALKRLTAERQYRDGLPISTLYAYDAFNRMKAIARVGTNGTSVVLRSFTYDGLGRLIGETNAVGVVTTYSYVWDANGQTVKTTIYAAGTGDAATRVETFARDGTFLSVTGSAVFPFRDSYPANTPLEIKRIALQADGTDSAQYRHTILDTALRLTFVLTPVSGGNGELAYFYNNLNQVKQFRSPEGNRLYTYNGRGEVEMNALDMDYPTTPDTINTSGTDRIVLATNDVVTDSGLSLFRSRTYVWPTNNNPNSILFTTREVSADRLLTREISFGLTNKDLVTYLGNGAVQVANTRPDNTSVTLLFQDGRLVSQTTRDSNLQSLHSLTFSYDEFDRRSAVVDSRNGTTIFAFDDENRTSSVTTPVPGAGLSAQTTQYFYDNRGRVIRTVHPDLASTTNTYTGTGQLKKQSGARVFTTEYTYDIQGRLVTNTTWNAGVPQEVYYRYEPTMGFLVAKQYSDGTSNRNVYANSSIFHKNLISSRYNARGTNIAYTYNTAGEITQVSYSNPNPGFDPTVTYEYDRLGRMVRMQRGGNDQSQATTNWFVYNDFGALLGESNQLFKIGIANSYDGLFRRSAQSFVSNATVLASTSYGYDNASRLSGLTNGVYSSALSYLAQSPGSVESIVNRQSSTVRHTVTRSYDFLDRVTKVASKPSTVPTLPFTYAYNDANQRTKTTLQDASYWSYQYDDLGQLNSAKRYWTAGSPVPGQQFEYAHDEVGNRTASASGGDSAGSGLRSFTYTANSLGQYTNRTTPGTFDVLGLANNLAAVSVNGTNGVYRHGEYFHKELSANNTAAAANTLVTNQAVLVTTTNQTGSYLLDRTNVVLNYDADGNLTNDGRWIYSWDAENRLKWMESTTNHLAVNKSKLIYLYDALGRRVEKTFATNQGGLTYVNQYTNRYLYDGDLIVAEVDQANRLLRSYVWGPGDETQLAVLLGVIDHTNSIGHFATADAAGHVAELVGGGSGVPTARYEYAPFGESIRSSGSFAAINPVRFAGQYSDVETGLSVFRHRVLNPSSGRWLQRDPMDEVDGPNLYAYVGNDPVNKADPLGLYATFQPTTWFDGKGYQPGEMELFNLQNIAGLLDTFNPSGTPFRDGGVYDPCDPVLRLGRDLAAFSRDILKIAGPLRAAKWAASGRTLAHVLTADGLTAYGLVQSADSVETGIEQIQAGDNWGYLNVGLGALGIKAGMAQFGTASQKYLSAARSLAVKNAPNIVYRGLTAADAQALRAGRGLTAKAPSGTWTAAEHVANAGPGVGGARLNSPWISTSRRLDVAQAYDTGHGVIAVDLNKVSSLQAEVWRTAPRVNTFPQGLPFVRSFWADEVTIYKQIPFDAILGLVK